jgi:hypothetical protein
LLLLLLLPLLAPPLPLLLELAPPLPLLLAFPCCARTAAANSAVCCSASRNA